MTISYILLVTISSSASTTNYIAILLVTIDIRRATLTTRAFITLKDILSRIIDVI